MKDTYTKRVPRQITILFLIMLIMVCFIGCSGVVKYSIKADNELNIERGEPRPVAIKLYMLTQKTKFEEADYSSLMDDPAGTLGDELIGNPIPYEVAPREIKTNLKIKKTKGMSFLGIVAGYSDPLDDKWRKIIPLTKNKIVFHLEKNYIKILYE